METRRRALDGNGDGNGAGGEDSSGDGNDNEDNGNENENRIGKGRKEAKKDKKPQNSCRQHVGRGENVEKKGLVQQLPTQIM